MPRRDVPEEVAAIRRAIEQYLNQNDEHGRAVGDAKYGVYAFYDYDGEPIYVGQTAEKLRVRIRRHLTNQRTDAVAMHVLDPFEVLDVAMWPMWDLEDRSVDPNEKSLALNQAEYTVYQRALEQSALKAVLNEKTIAPTRLIALPSPIRGRIVPPEVYELRKHPDIRIARRASTIARLASVISERAVSPGLRRTLVTQARRLERLARQRMPDGESDLDLEALDEETEESADPR